MRSRDKIQVKSGPKGARTLDLHNAIVALSQAELWALDCVVCHPLTMRNGHPGAAYWSSTAQLPDEFGLGARRYAVPGSHCCRLSAAMAYYFRSTLLAQCALLTDDILAAGRVVVKVGKAEKGRVRAKPVRPQGPGPRPAL